VGIIGQKRENGTRKRAGERAPVNPALKKYLTVKEEEKFPKRPKLREGERKRSGTNLRNSETEKKKGRTE